MTWAERIGDLATRLALVILLALRIVTELIRLVFVMLDSFVMDLGGRSEGGLRRIEASDRAWVRLPGSVLLGIAFVLLQFLAIFTVLFRQAATKLNDFVVGLAEGEERISGFAPATPPPALPGTATASAGPVLTPGTPAPPSPAEGTAGNGQSG
ncbi:MAG: hypothetical protein IRY83_04900 [Chloroflexi bacterium]|nr:hypothetical protein [Chloroflexota bacterium]